MKRNSDSQWDPMWITPWICTGNWNDHLASHPGNNRSLDPGTYVQGLFGICPFFRTVRTASQSWMTWKTNHGPKKTKYSEKSGHFKKTQPSHWMQTKTNQQTEISFLWVLGKGQSSHWLETPVFSCFDYQKKAGPMYEMLSHETPAGLAWILKEI